MADYLKIKLNKDVDGTAGILATVKSGSFSGSGEAWFNITAIDQFAIELKSFAETTKSSPIIEGGHWDGKGNLQLLLLSLRFYTFSSYRCGVQVNLAEYPSTDCREEEIFRVIVELKPTAQEIVEFSEQLTHLLNSKIEEAILECR